MLKLVVCDRGKEQDQRRRIRECFFLLGLIKKYYSFQLALGHSEFTFKNETQKSEAEEY
jgi:hypothetical protein